MLIVPMRPEPCPQCSDISIQQMQVSMECSDVTTLAHTLTHTWHAAVELYITSINTLL